VGDFVFGSTINGNAVVYVRVKAVGMDSALSQIVKLVETAQMDKAPVQAFADRVASVFTPCVLCLALFTFISWLVASYSGMVPHSWFKEEYGNPVLFSLLFGISVVVISCPCALGLATPTAVMVGTSVGAQNGVLIKGGQAFESAYRFHHQSNPLIPLVFNPLFDLLRSVRKVIFDKTGTLTCGTPAVTDVFPTGIQRKYGDIEIFTCGVYICLCRRSIHSGLCDESGSYR
jgi:Cu+-exporting ATPase